MTERNRAGTLSPTSSNPDNERRISSQYNSNVVVWNEKEEPYIKKWIDYTNKYGIGYLLTNDTCGVYFNDSSKIILQADNQTAEYFAKSKHTAGAKFNINNYPEELKKKITLLLYFKNYLQGKDE